MYGYLGLNFKANKEEILTYSYYYCGICFSLKENFGDIYRISIIKEVVLFAMMKNDIVNPEPLRCLFSSFKKRLKPNSNNFFQEYAYLNVLIIYGKLLDYKLEKKKIPLPNLKKIRNKLKYMYSEDFLRNYENLIKDQYYIELSKKDLDDYMKPSQNIMKLIFSLYFKNNDIDEIAVAAGTLVYLIDALYDFKKDKISNNFNAIRSSFKINKLDKMNKYFKDRIIFTYDICSMKILHNYLNITTNNNNLVKKTIVNSLKYHRNKVCNILYN